MTTKSVVNGTLTAAEVAVRIGINSVDYARTLIRTGAVVPTEAGCKSYLEARASKTSTTTKSKGDITRRVARVPQSKVQMFDKFCKDNGIEIVDERAVAKARNETALAEARKKFGVK